jgi:hypothetical protein
LPNSSECALAHWATRPAGADAIIATIDELTEAVRTS